MPANQRLSPAQKGCLSLVAVATLLVASPFAVRGAVNLVFGRRIFAPQATPARSVAIVFGAAVYGDRLSSVLRDRMDTAIDLYQAGLVDGLLVSGGEGSDFSEPAAMRDYAVQRGVPIAAITLDREGRRTYDTCYRAKHLFGIENATLVTQDFHLPRSLLTCRALGMDAVGASADRQPYRYARWYELRETAATLVAVWDVMRRQPPAPWQAAVAPG